MGGDLVDHGTSPVSLNAAITGLKLFVEVTLDQVELMARREPVRVPRTLPVVLSRDEAARLIAATRNLKHQTALSVAYLEFFAEGLHRKEIALLLIEIAACAAKRGRGITAAELRGASGILRRQIGVPLPSREHEHLEEDTRAIRASAGDGFDRAYDEGGRSGFRSRGRGSAARAGIPVVRVGGNRARALSIRHVRARADRLLPSRAATLPSKGS